MATGRLVAGNVELQIEAAVDIQLDYLIADIRNIDQRNAALSLSVIVVDTPEANKLFNNIYDVNAKLSTFNPNKKIKAYYYVNEVEVFRGNLQLIEIEKVYDGQLVKVRYRCFLLGNNADLFLELKTKFLTDIDFSDLNHIFQDVAGNYQPVLGEGYCYPYIDYGLTILGEDRVQKTNVWTFTHLKPAIFEKDYLDRIFADAGFTYQSTFLNSDYYKRIIIPCNYAGAMRSTSIPANQAEFLATRNPTLVGALKAGTTDVPNQWWTFYANLGYINNPIIFNVDTTDIGNVYNNLTGIMTIPYSGVYTFETTGNIQLQFTTQNSIDFIQGTNPTREMSFQVAIVRLQNNGSGPEDVPAFQTITVPVDLSRGGGFTTLQIPFSFSTPLTGFIKGDRVRVALQQSVLNSVYTKTSTGTIVINQATSMRVDIIANSTFQNHVESFALGYGETVEMNDQVPKNITQLDFLKGIIISENLYIEQDPNNETNYFIEPRNEFVNSVPFIDWTNRVDTKQPIRILPAGEVNINKYIFRQQGDNDFANAFNQSFFNEFYGQQVVFVDSDFAQTTKEVIPIFAATPNVGNTINNIVTPAFFKRLDNGTVEPLDVTIRRIYWKGRIPCEQYTWFKGDGSASVLLSEYSYAGSTDHPYTMTLDLGMGVPDQLYYTFTGVYTSNNRYNIQYKDLIESLNDKQSKLVKMTLNLTPTDIFNFTFRQLVYIIDSYYYVNAIKGFNPQDNGSVEVELLWLNTNDFTPTL